MNDITKVFELGIEAQDGYDPYKIMDIINSTGYFGDDVDENNWILVWENTDTESIFYAFISRFYPAALVKDNCPEAVRNALKDNNIFIAKFEEPFYCEEGVLKKYVRYLGRIVLDDRFLDDCNFSLDDPRLDCIYDSLKSGREYVTSYNFTFDEIR